MAINLISRMTYSDWKKYVLAFVITAAIFITALYVSNRVSTARVDEIAATQDKISLDIAASETQFALLGERSCETVGESTLSDEMGSLAAKLSYTEARLGSDNPEVLQQKKYYSLLEVKDFLLSKKMTEKCGWEPVTILYFYSNQGDCPDCANEGYVLTHLHQLYPQIRVYSFDYNLDFSIIDTMRTMYHIKGPLPALVINDAKATYGFKDEDTLVNSNAQLKAIVKAAAAKNATTTPVER